MKSFKFEIDLSRLKLSSNEQAYFQKDGQKSAFETIMNQALQSKHPQGIKGPMGRLYSRILNKLDSASGGVLELEEAEFDLIKALFTGNDISYQPQQYRLISLYQQAVEFAEK